MRTYAEFLCELQVRASSVPPPRELPTAPLIQRQRRGSIAPGAPASNVSSRLREREAEFARQVRERERDMRHLRIVCLRNLALYFMLRTPV